jgi:hypothetical protein
MNIRLRRVCCRTIHICASCLLGDGRGGASSFRMASSSAGTELTPTASARSSTASGKQMQVRRERVARRYGSLVEDESQSGASKISSMKVRAHPRITWRSTATSNQRARKSSCFGALGRTGVLVCITALASMFAGVVLLAMPAVSANFQQPERGAEVPTSPVAPPPPLPTPSPRGHSPAPPSPPLACSLASQVSALHHGWVASVGSSGSRAPCRLRREITMLSMEERERFFDALLTMKRTAGPVGRVHFGPSYYSYDELVTTHINSVQLLYPNETRDVHFGPAFVLYHRRLLLRFEASLRAIDPSIEAMPYWNAALDAHSVEESIVWSADWFGPLRGEPSMGYAVASGRLNDSFRVPHAASVRHANDHGLLRGHEGRLATPYVVRMPAVETYPGVEASGIGCISTSTFLDFHACQDREHRCIHQFIGGTSRCAPTEVQAELGWDQNVLFGDYLNSAASVLDPIFFPHHANIDRKFLAWQLRHHDLVASHYTYPSHQPAGHRLYDLCGPPDDPMTDDAGVPMTNAQVLAEAPDY